MTLRVIAGTAKGRHLKMVPGEGTRPIMDRAKEALFSILGQSIRAATFLDLYAGTGSVGIEALSRGAEHAVFVENARAAISTIEANLKIAGLAEKAEIIRRDVRDYLRQANPRPFEFVYVAPPQYKNLWRDTLLLIDSHPGHLQPDAVVVVQIDPEEKGDIVLNTLVAVDERRYGNTLLWFFEHLGD